MSKSQKYWQNIIDEFYDKYRTIAAWHTGLVKTVLETGQLTIPTGRAWTFSRAEVAQREWFWRPKILNYPVQALGADLVAIGRVTMWKRLQKAGIPVLFQSTVHDSIDLDVDKDEKACYNICMVLKKSIQDIPTNFERLFGVPFDLPLNCEISYGPTLKDQKPV